MQESAYITQSRNIVRLEKVLETQFPAKSAGLWSTDEGVYVGIKADRSDLTLTPERAGNAAEVVAERGLADIVDIVPVKFSEAELLIDQPAWAQGSTLLAREFRAWPLAAAVRGHGRR